MIGIRVDANNTIAMGHVVRCMAIAKFQREAGQDVLFIMSDDYAIDYVQKNGFNVLCLKNSYQEKEAELEALTSILKARKIICLLIDSYEVTPEYMKQLRAIVKVAYIDDLNLYNCTADLIINCTCKADLSQYKLRGYHEDNLLLGNKYMPLRPEFSDEPIHINDTIQSIFMTTGGTDHYDMIISLLEQLQQSPLRLAKKYIVVGKFYKNYQALQEMQASDDTIVLYQDIDTIACIMRKADIAISAGGMTLMELCSLGIPTIGFVIAENQLESTIRYAKSGVLLYAGDVRENKHTVITNVISAITDDTFSYSNRCELSRKARKLVDGKGALRIAEAVIALSRNV